MKDSLTMTSYGFNLVKKDKLVAFSLIENTYDKFVIIRLADCKYFFLKEENKDFFIFESIENENYKKRK